MRCRLRHYLLEWILRLRFAPFTWVFASIYKLACVLVVRGLRRRPGLIAIYLSGSSASGRKILGLSDIDFKIILAGRRDAREIHSIRRHFMLLRRWFPMLGPPDEKGIYFLDDLEEEYRAYPLVRLLFDSRFYRNRLLWGQDWLQHRQFPHLGRADLKQALPWRLKEWNEKILLLLDAPSFARPQRRYLLWKALADMGRFLSLLHNPSVARLLPRADAVPFLAELLPEPLRRSVTASQEEFEHHFVVDRMSDDERFDLWREVLRFIAHSIGDCAENTTIAVVAHTQARQAAGDPHWEMLCQAAPSDARCILTDFFFLPSSPLDADGYGSYARIIRLQRSLKAEEYRGLRQCFRAGSFGKEPVFVIEEDRMGHCLCSPMLDHYLITETSADGLLPFLIASENEGAGYSARSLFASHLRLRLDQLTQQLPSVLESRQVPRLGRERVLRFFFSNLQTLFLKREMADESGTLHLPGGPESLIERLIERGLPDAVASFLHQKARALRGSRGSVAWPSLRQLLMQSLEAACSGRDWQDVTLPPEEPVTLSLIVVTNNRARLLERCLDSVRAQSRPPNELVVVDNGSTDDTPDVVQRFKPPYPVHYILEPLPGVGRARVRGCANATGDILAFIDDDAIAEPHWLEAMEETFCLDPHVGVAGGRIEALAGSRSDWVSHAFGGFGEA